MSIKIIAIPETRRAVGKFVHFSEDVYRHDIHWASPLFRDQIQYILSGPFNSFGEKRLLMAYREARPVARLSVHRNFAYDDRYGAGQGFFGFFEALDDPEAVAAIFEAGEAWLKARGCREVLGPMSFSIYEEIGLLVRGFDESPVIMCPYNPPYYADLLTRVGYRREIDWFSFRFDRHARFPAHIEQIHQTLLSRSDVEIRSLNLKEWHTDAKTIRHIFNDAWSENWGHLPIEEEQWAYITDHLKLALIEDLSFMILIDGKPAGFLIIVKDMNEALKKIQGRLLPFGLFKLLYHSRRISRIRVIVMGILKEYRYLGCDLALAVEALKRAIELGYETYDCSQIVESNERMIQGMEALGGDRYKTFRIYKKIIA